MGRHSNCSERKPISREKYHESKSQYKKLSSFRGARLISAHCALLESSNKPCTLLHFAVAVTGLSRSQAIQLMVAHE